MGADVGAGALRGCCVAVMGSACLHEVRVLGTETGLPPLEHCRSSLDGIGC
eukprot:COSAG03_NODE_253_length_9917_cov_116.496944_4_plen_51_part_00